MHGPSCKFHSKASFFPFQFSMAAVSTSSSDSLAKLVGLFISSPSAALSPHFPTEVNPDMRHMAAAYRSAGRLQPNKRRRAEGSRCQVCGGNVSADLWVTRRQQTAVLITSSISPSRNKPSHWYFTPPPPPMQPFYQLNMSCSCGQNRDRFINQLLTSGSLMEGDQVLHEWRLFPLIPFGTLNFATGSRSKAKSAVKWVKPGPNRLGYSRLLCMFHWTEPCIFTLMIRVWIGIRF